MVDITYIEGSCAETQTIPAYNRASFLEFCDLTEQELDDAQRTRINGEDDCTDITLISTTMNDVVTIFNSDGEARFFICPLNSASIEKVI